jgi:hypothetical protein
MPPVNGFWSLTMYGAAYFFVPNPLNSYTLSSRNKFVSNPDGSVDLYLQATRRARRRKSIGCLLPTLVSFLCGACTGPKETPPSIMDGTCKPPAVKEAQYIQLTQQSWRCRGQSKTGRP